MSYFVNYLNNFKDKKVNIYVDMDGVVADYDMLGFEENKDEDDVYLNKRAVTTTIKVLEEVNNLNNVNLYILSVSRNENQIPGKVKWLEKNMPFITKEQINILPREGNDFKPAHELKKIFLKGNTNPDEVNIMIDDSHSVLYTLHRSDINVIPLHITSILD